jgi:hypothetical protein
MTIDPTPTPRPIATASPFLSPEPVGLTAAYGTVYSVSAPVLAGFAMTLVGLVASDRAAYAASDLILLLAVGATGSLVFSLQVGVWAQQYAAAPADYLGWYPLAKANDLALEEVRRRQLNDSRHWSWYLGRAAALYRLGLVCVLGAVALVALPAGATVFSTTDPLLSLMPFALGLLWLLVEVWWIAAVRWPRVRHPLITTLPDIEPGPSPEGFGPHSLQ